MQQQLNLNFLEHALTLRNEYALWASAALIRLRLTTRQRRFLTALCMVSNEPQELATLVDYAYSQLMFGAPLPTFNTPQSDASWWVSRATLDERKAFLVACYGSLSPALKRDFIDFALNGVDP